MTLIGVSIAVPDPHGPILQAYRLGLGDTAAAGIPTHVTLLPPFELPTSQIGAASEHLGEVASNHRAFRLHLRGTGTFRPVSPVVFVNVVAGISQCEMLARDVRSNLLEVSPRFPYHPHVTVAHGVNEHQLDKAFDELARFDETFEASAFSLYVHDASLGWEPIADFALAASDRAPTEG